MFYSVSYQTYRYEHGLTAADQRVADVTTGEAAAALTDLRLRIRRALTHRVRPAYRPAAAARPSVQPAASTTRILSGIR